MARKPIRSRFKGRCKECERVIEKGEMVWWQKGGGVVCPGCYGNEKPQTPKSVDYLEYLRRWRSGEGIADLARELDVPWQRLSAILKRIEAGQTAEEAETETGKGGSPDTTSDRSFEPSQADLDGVYRSYFDSVQSLVDDAFSSRGLTAARAKWIVTEHEKSYGSRWANGYDKATLLAAMENPPRHLLDAVDSLRQEICEELDLNNPTKRRRVRNRDWGDELDVDAWQRCDPFGWERRDFVTVHGGIVTVGVNLTVSGKESPSNLLYRGAAAAALTDVLCEQGYSVRIVGFLSTTDPSEKVGRQVTTVEIKAADMPMDLGAVSVALAEVAFFRLAVVFAALRSLPGKIHSSYGRAACIPSLDLQGFDFVIEREVMSRKAAVDWVRSAVESKKVWAV